MRVDGRDGPDCLADNGVTNGVVAGRLGQDLHAYIQRVVLPMLILTTPLCPSACVLTCPTTAYMLSLAALSFAPSIARARRSCICVGLHRWTRGSG